MFEMDSLQKILPEFLTNDNEKKDKLFHKIQNSRHFKDFIFDNLFLLHEKKLFWYSCLMLPIYLLFTIFLLVKGIVDNIQLAFDSSFVLLGLLILQSSFLLILKRIQMSKVLRYKFFRIVNFFIFYIFLIFVIYNFDNLNDIAMNIEKEISSQDINNSKYEKNIRLEVSNYEENNILIKEKIFIFEDKQDISYKWNLIINPTNFSVLVNEIQNINKSDDIISNPFLSISLNMEIENNLAEFHQNNAVIQILFTLFFISGVIAFHLSHIIITISSIFNVIFFLVILKKWKYYDTWIILTHNIIITILAFKAIDLYFMRKYITLKYENLIKLIFRNNEIYNRIIGDNSILFKNKTNKEIVFNNFASSKHNDYLYKNSFNSSGRIDKNEELNVEFISELKQSNNSKSGLSNDLRDSDSQKIVRCNTVHDSKIKKKYNLNETQKNSEEFKKSGKNKNIPSANIMEKELLIDKDNQNQNINFNKSLMSEASFEIAKNDIENDKELNFDKLNNNINIINANEKSFYSSDSKNISRKKSKFYEIIRRNSEKKSTKMNSLFEKYNVSYPKREGPQLNPHLNRGDNNVRYFKNKMNRVNESKENSAKKVFYEINYYDIEFLKYFIEFNLEDFDLQKEKMNFLQLIKNMKTSDRVPSSEKSILNNLYIRFFFITKIFNYKKTKLNLVEFVHREKEIIYETIPKPNLIEKSSNLYEKLFNSKQYQNILKEANIKNSEQKQTRYNNKKNLDNIDNNNCLSQNQENLQKINEEKFIGHYFNIGSFFEIFQNEKKNTSVTQINLTTKSLISVRSNFLNEISNNQKKFPKVYSVYICFLSKLDLEQYCSKIKSKKETEIKENEKKCDEKYLIINNNNSNIIQEENEFSNKFLFNEVKYHQNSLFNKQNENLNESSQKLNMESLKNIGNSNIEVSNLNIKNLDKDKSFQQENSQSNPINVNQTKNIYNINIDKLKIYDFGIKSYDVKTPDKANKSCLNCFKRKKGPKNSLSSINNANLIVDKIKCILDQRDKCSSQILNAKDTSKMKQSDANNESRLTFGALNNSHLVMNKEMHQVVDNKNPEIEHLKKEMNRDYHNNSHIKKTNNNFYYSILIFKEIDREFILSVSQYNNKKDKKLSKLIHELKTPLNSIIGITVDTIENLNFDTHIDNLNLLKDLSRYSTFLINDITQSLNSHLSDIYGVDIEEINIYNILEFSYNILKALLKCYDTKSTLIFPFIEIDENVSKFIFLSDDIRLKQIILNIISNAVKFTKKGFIKISAKIVKEPSSPNKAVNNIKQHNFSKHNSIQSRKKSNGIYNVNYNLVKEDLLQLKKSQSLFINYLEITISDSGIGIEEKNKKKIFISDNAMIKGNNNNSNKFGSGLGLNIAFKLASMLDHQLRFESKFGEGTTFKILLKCFNVNSNIVNDDKSTLYYSNNTILSQRNMLNNANTNINSNNASFFKKKQKTYNPNNFYITKSKRCLLRSTLSCENSENSEYNIQSDRIFKKYQSEKKISTNIYNFRKNSYSKQEESVESRNENENQGAFEGTRIFINQNSSKEEVSSNFNLRDTNISKFKLNIFKQENSTFNQKSFPYLNDKSSKNNHDSERFEQTKIFTPHPSNKNLNIYSVFKREDTNSSKMKSSERIENNEPINNPDLICPADNINFFQKNILKKLFTIKKISQNIDNNLAHNIGNTNINNSRRLKLGKNLPTRQGNSLSKVKNKNAKKLGVNSSKIDVCNSLISSLRMLNKDSKRPKILIIDDQKYIRTSLKNILRQVFDIKRLQFEIVEGNDGLDILRNVIEDNRYSLNSIKLIFTDENMEYINGTKAIEIIREMERANKIMSINKFCIISSNDDQQNKNIFSRKGADFVINKPCNFNAVLGVFNKLEDKINENKM